MNEKVNLKIDWCSYEAAKYAVENWHYSHVMPASKTVKIGAWENGVFIGCVIFSRGANQHLGKAYNLSINEVTELTRVALSNHITATSKIVAIAIRFLKKQSPGLRLIISYADCDQKHIGVIYQASNWIYSGMVQTGGGTPKYMINGIIKHGRSIYAKFGRGSQNLEWLKNHVDPNAEKVYTLGKHKYLFPLDNAIKKQIEPLRKPYPKRERGEIDSAPQSNVETEGASPIRSLLQDVESVIKL